MKSLLLLLLMFMFMLLLVRSHGIAKDQQHWGSTCSTLFLLQCFFVTGGIHCWLQVEIAEMGPPWLVVSRGIPWLEDDAADDVVVLDALAVRANDAGGHDERTDWVLWARIIT